MGWKKNIFTGKLDYFKKLSEAITHSELSDMPDTGGANSDHDTRYYTETELNAGQLDSRYYTESECDSRYLKLDQTTPQTVSGGIPVFSSGMAVDGSLDLAGVNANVNLFSDVSLAGGQSTLYLKLWRAGTSTGSLTLLGASASQIIASNTLSIGAYNILTLQPDGYSVSIGASGITSVVPTFYQFGYITAAGAAKYISWKVDDTDDYFLLDREDTNILGFKINMPTLMTSLTASQALMTDADKKLVSVDYLNQAVKTTSDVTHDDLTLTGNLNLPTTTSTVGQILINSTRFIHTYGTNNVFIGTSAGNFTTSGTGTNVAIGSSVLRAVSTGYYNVGIGGTSLYSLTTGANNMAIGSNSLVLLSTTSDNTAVGFGVLYNCIGSQNTGIGSNALAAVTTAGNNVGIGFSALDGTTGAQNTSIGGLSGRTNTTGANNIWIGYLSGNNASQINNASNSIAIGANTYTTASNQVVIGDTNITATLLRGLLTIGQGAVGIDYSITFDGETNDGVLTWMEDEDYFKFSDNVNIDTLTASKVVFTNASKTLTSTGIGTSSQFIKGDGSLDSSTYAIGGTGADTRVAFWTGANTLSSNANFVYEYSLDNLKVGNINLPNAGAFLFGTNNNDGCWRLVRDSNDLTFQIFGSSTWNKRVVFASGGQILVGDANPFLGDQTCTLRMAGTLAGLYAYSTTGQFQNRMSILTMADFWTVDDTNRVRLSICNYSNIQQACSIFFYGNDGGAYGGAPEAKWELGTDYLMNGTQSFYLYDSKNSRLSWLVDSAGVFILSERLRLQAYTVATLPAGTQGDTAFVTDALAPVFLGVIAGGGAVVTPVFYDGTNWIAA